ncbi:MAG TPA: four helix bundle protein [Pyrinomonadaceae bacterium]|nr:four helix bundle protein [Pyrinomonadaceae bacterium]
MRPHQKLEAWGQSIDFVVAIYNATDSFPKEEKFGLTSQIRRAAISVPTNIAEGAARSSKKEFAYFISNAQGSASELETELIIAHRLGYLSEQLFCELIRTLERLGRLISGLARFVRNS